MKKIEDYLHLHFKCWGTVYDSKDEIYTNGEWALSGTLLHSIMIGDCKFRPHLRPLPSMTEDEMKECGNMDYDFSDDPKLNKFSWENFNCLLTPNQFTYLLKKGFDLFDLIPEGLAIDKTTQP